jgi:hypothetical protein
VLSLLEDCQRRQTTLDVPHTGLRKDRFKDAMSARNLRFRLYSQPQLRHHCRRCFRIINGRKVWVCVIDGVTVGCPCCSVHNCHIPLENNHRRFCPPHTFRASICAIVGCENPVVTGSLACAEPSHKEVERIHRERGQARFQLKERLQRARVAHPNDAVASERNLSELVDEEEEEFDVEAGNQEEPAVPPTVNPKPKKIRAQFGRKRSHNEQIIVCPCGIILARETFYGAEGVASVVVSAYCARKGTTANRSYLGNDQENLSWRHQARPYLF